MTQHVFVRTKLPVQSAGLIVSHVLQRRQMQINDVQSSAHAARGCSILVQLDSDPASLQDGRMCAQDLTVGAVGNAYMLPITAVRQVNVVSAIW